jgi:hypothetical protein
LYYCIRIIYFQSVVALAFILLGEGGFVDRILPSTV